MLTMTIGLGADSTATLKRSSARLRSVMSTIAARTNEPSAVLMGLRPISTGTSVPSARWPNRSRPAPMERERVCEEAPAVGGVLGSESFRHQNLDRLVDEILSAEAEELLGLSVDEHDLPRSLIMTMALGADSTTSRKRSSARFLLGDVDAATAQDELPGAKTELEV